VIELKCGISVHVNTCITVQLYLSRFFQIIKESRKVYFVTWFIFFLVVAHGNFIRKVPVTVRITSGIKIIPHVVTKYSVNKM